MKKFNFNFAFLLLLGLLFVGCNKDNEFIEDTRITQEMNTDIEAMDAEAVDGEDTPQLMRGPFLNPCYPSPYEILPNVNSQTHCEIYYGCLWHNNACYWCW